MVLIYEYSMALLRSEKELVNFQLLIDNGATFMILV